MKTLYLIRHAKSSWDHPDLQDWERPLNKRGNKDAPLMAKQLKKNGVLLDAIITSSALRTVQTTKYFKKEFELTDEQLLVEPPLYLINLDDLVHFIQNKLEDDWSSVAIVTHNPTLTDFAGDYWDEFVPNVPTCGILKVNLNAEHWHLFSKKTAAVDAFMYPKMFKETAKGVE